LFQDLALIDGPRIDVFSAYWQRVWNDADVENLEVVLQKLLWLWLRVGEPMEEEEDYDWLERLPSIFKQLDTIPKVKFLSRNLLSEWYIIVIFNKIPHGNRKINQLLNYATPDADCAVEALPEDYAGFLHRYLRSRRSLNDFLQEARHFMITPAALDERFQSRLKKKEVILAYLDNALQAKMTEALVDQIIPVFTHDCHTIRECQIAFRKVCRTIFENIENEIGWLNKEILELSINLFLALSDKTNHRKIEGHRAELRTKNGRLAKLQKLITPSLCIAFCNGQNYQSKW